LHELADLARKHARVAEVGLVADGYDELVVMGVFARDHRRCAAAHLVHVAGEPDFPASGVPPGQRLPAILPGLPRVGREFRATVVTRRVARGRRRWTCAARIDKYDSRVRMTGAKREYSGAALNSFILALGHSHGIVQKILTHAGVDRIDPERWYEFGWAASIYYKIGVEVGRAALIEVGRKMIESAEYPGGINGIHTLLMA